MVGSLRVSPPFIVGLTGVYFTVYALCRLLAPTPEIVSRSNLTQDTVLNISDLSPDDVLYFGSQPLRWPSCFVSLQLGSVIFGVLLVLDGLAGHFYDTTTTLRGQTFCYVNLETGQSKKVVLRQFHFLVVTFLAMLALWCGGIVLFWQANSHCPDCHRLLALHDKQRRIWTLDDCTSQSVTSFTATTFFLTLQGICIMTTLYLTVSLYKKICAHPEAGEKVPTSTIHSKSADAQPVARDEVCLINNPGVSTSSSFYLPITNL